MPSKTDRIIEFRDLIDDFYTHVQDAHDKMTTATKLSEKIGLPRSAKTEFNEAKKLINSLAGMVDNLTTTIEDAFESEDFE